ncbi:transporter substrate-binding domain-containing protein [Halomonas sp. LR5S13]|uniref:transporter substrate-binding domain-containing protein n=1 Tax=Halomonas rhizosphaerae TaxID=3043296 RepID=UPI0024A8DAB7|nr:transporter substrate-binding domain-containing protein [Halomonas rhizosphaerae]MDI5919260.1 transporter substrate-binding domain-containing protein [Halomonas rhizosphaerae]
MTATPITPLFSHRFATTVRRIVVWLVAGFAALPASGLAQNGDETIVVGGDRYHPPYEFLDEDGRPAGYNVELTRAIAEVMGIEVRIELGDWSAMRRGLESGVIDVLQGMSYSEQRDDAFDFAPPHAIVHQSIFARRGTPPVQDLEALRGKEVIVQRGDIMHDYLVEQSVGAELITTDTHGDALRALAAGRHDYALVANLPALYLSRELGLINLEPVARPFSLRYGYAVREGNADLLAQFSEGLAILKNTGRHQAIYDEWLGPMEQADGIPWKRIGLVGAIASGLLLLILGGIVVWNRMLKREVASRTEELRRQQQQLIQADKMTSLGILVSGVAHEINNPSSLLLLNLPVLRDAYADAQPVLDEHYRQQGDFPLGGLPYSRMRDEIPAMLDEMLEGSQRIKRIVGDLKDFARQGSSELGECLDLNAAVQTAVRLVDNSIRKATDRFETRYADDLPDIQGNAQRIEQVVINLVLNACQALEGRGQGIYLTTRYLPGDGAVALEVRDEGRGIDPESIHRLTDPFFTTRRECGGTGLGLSVSAGIVREHQGRLDFDSRPGEGTTVTLTLPLAATRDADSPWTQADR